MPRAQQFERSTIYNIRHAETGVVIYVGSSTNFATRKTKHKYNCNKIGLSAYHLPVYVHIRANGGFDAYEIVPVEYLVLTCKVELQIAEQTEMNKHQTLLNKYCAHRPPAQYYIDNKEHIKEIKAQYYIDNIKHEKGVRAQYRLDNSEYVKEANAQYKALNADKIKLQRTEKITCDCGCIISRAGISSHKKSKKHIRLIDALLNAADE